MNRALGSKRSRIEDEAHGEMASNIGHCTNLTEAQLLIDKLSKEIDNLSKEMDTAKSCCIKLRDELRKSRQSHPQPESSTLCELCKDRTKNMDKLAKEKDTQIAANDTLKMELDQVKSNIHALSIESSNYREAMNDSNKRLEHAQQVYRATARNRDAICELLMSTDITPPQVNAVQSLAQLESSYVKQYQSTAFNAMREELDNDEEFCKLYDLNTDEIERLMVSNIKPDHWIYPIVERHIEPMLVRFTAEFKLMAPWFIQHNRPATDSLWFVRRSQNDKLKQHDTDGVQSAFDAIGQMFKRFEKTLKSGDMLEVTMTRATATMCIRVLTTMQRLRFPELATMIQTQIHSALLESCI